MQDILHGFGSTEVFTLIVGPNKEKLLVPKDILTLIPHFKQALSSGLFAESQSKSFQFLELDVRAVADVIYYVHTQTVEKIPEFGEWPTFEAFQSLQAHLRAYIVADMWNAKSTANALVDEIIDYHKGNSMHPDIITILISEGQIGTPLYELLLQEQAVCICHQAYLDWQEFDAPDGDEDLVKHHPRTFHEVCRNLPQETLSEIMCAIQNISDMPEGPSYPIEAAASNLQKYHK